MEIDDGFSFTHTQTFSTDDTIKEFEDHLNWMNDYSSLKNQCHEFDDNTNVKNQVEIQKLEENGKGDLNQAICQTFCLQCESPMYDDDYFSLTNFLSDTRTNDDHDPSKLTSLKRQIFNIEKVKKSVTSTECEESSDSSDESDDVFMFSIKKPRKAETEFVRFDEPFKNIKSKAFTKLVYDKILKYEKFQNVENWQNILSILKNFRVFFTINVKKADNRKWMGMKVIEIIEEVYQKSIPKQIKKEKNTKIVNELQNLLSMIEIDDLASYFKDEGSLKVLNMTYQEVLEKFRHSHYKKNYIKFLLKTQSEEYVKKFETILNRTSDYLNKKKVTKKFIC